jgi:hypothetical protein
MAFAYLLELPPNTPKDNPIRITARLTGRIIKGIGYTIPSGCSGLVGIRFLDRETQILPINPGGWFTGNGVDRDFEFIYEFLTSPYILYIEGYNEDDTFWHRPEVRIYLEPERALGELFLLPKPSPSSLLGTVGQEG